MKKIKIKLSVDLITTISEIACSILIVSGIGELLGKGAALIASGVAVLTLSYFASGTAAE
jgi:hypothetical protein